MNRLSQKEYFKPNEFLNQASSFYVKSLEQRQKDKAEQMFLGARLNRSLQNTLKQTDVWAKNHYVFKLSGAGPQTDRGQISKRTTE